MQLVFSYGLFFLSCLSFQSNLQAQSAILGRFTAGAVQEKVLLDWQIQAGRTCDGIGIYRGTDSVDMSLIHYIPGVCGDLSRPVSYLYLDSFPHTNQVSYYRLELGPRIFSAPVSLSLVDLQGQPWQFRPHPVAETARFYFAGSAENENRLLLYDMKGSKRLEISFFGNEASWSTLEFENGLYVFILYDHRNKPLQQGRMLVRH